MSMTTLGLVCAAGGLLIAIAGFSKTRPGREPTLAIVGGLLGIALMLMGAMLASADGEERTAATAGASLTAAIENG